MDISILHSLIRDGIQTGIINYLREYKLTDIMFLRGAPTEYLNSYRVSDDLVTFYEESIPQSNLNIL
jgi:hypothetical protein